MKTSELIDTALDWAVARAEKRSIWLGDWLAVPPDTALRFRSGPESEAGLYFVGGGFYSPSTIWAQGGPIIEWERITLRYWSHSNFITAYMPLKNRDDDPPWIHGSTPLIAAMRCYVVSKLGDEVEIPEELS